MYKLIIVSLLLIFSYGCGHVETYKDYYSAEQIRFQQHKETLAAVAASQAQIQQQMIEYAKDHPLVKIKNADGTEIVINQSIPQTNLASLEHIQMPRPSVEPREAPGEKFLMKFTDNAMMFGLGWLFSDTIKSGFENAGHNTSTAVGGNMTKTNVGGDISIPTTTTNTNMLTDVNNPSSVSTPVVTP